MRTALLIITLLCGVRAMSQQVGDSIVAEHYQTPYFDAAIFPASYPMAIAKKSKAFTPTHADIDKAEAALNDQLEALNKSKILQQHPFIIDEDLGKYRRQYAGYVDKRGDSILYINCFWHGTKVAKETDDWLRTLREVMDGGSAFWSVRYHMRKHQLFDLSVNGEG